jgi:hypothetical protein
MNGYGWIGYVTLPVTGRRSAAVKILERDRVIEGEEEIDEFHEEKEIMLK